MRKLNDQASPVRINGNVVHMGFPKMYVKLYPRQSCRINTGWNLDSLPSDTYMKTEPKDSVLTAGLLSLPRTIHAQ